MDLWEVACILYKKGPYLSCRLFSNDVMPTVTVFAFPDASNLSAYLVACITPLRRTSLSLMS